MSSPACYASTLRQLQFRNTAVDRDFVYSHELAPEVFHGQN